MTQAPPPMSGPGGQPGGYLRAHRGVLILVFGILSWLVCFIFGIAAWVMGNSDLQAMQAGEMDSTGEGLTQAGKIVGMISVILSLVLIPVVILLFILGAIGAAAGAAGGP